MAKKTDATATGRRSAQEFATAVREAFRRRIGDERYAVWFGDAFVVEVGMSSAASPLVTIRVGSGVTHEWLRRTFRADLEAAAREACGPGACLEWQANVDDDAPAVPAADAPSKPRRTRRPAPAAPASDRPPPADRTHAPQGTPTRRRRVPGLADFVVGASNRMAIGAIELAAARPGEMSPLVIHGPSGVGKTHLLDGACARARELHPGIAVVSLSAEQFTTGFLQALHGSGLPGFRRTCRNADLLVIDDLHFFVGKKTTLLEFQHTVDALHRQGRQMIFACDRELDALDGLGTDLLCRLRGGMNARILPPDYDVRRGIVASVCAARSLAVPDDVIHYVATHMTRHARELLGAVNRLEATSLMLGLPMSLGMAEDALSDLVRSSARSVRLADIEKAVCKAFGIESGTLQSARRARTVSHPRMLAMYLARKHTHAALAEIGSYFGRRSHSTVIAAQRAVDDWVASRSRIVLAETSWDADEAIRRVEDVLRAG